MITNNDAQPIGPDSGKDPINPVQPKSPVEAIEADKFSDMMNKNKELDAAQAEDASDGEITPEELQRQISESMFRRGFQRAIERAREITKEMKE